MAGLIEANLGEYAFKGGAFAELAAATGIDVDGFVDEMETYNGYAATGVDADFGKDASMLMEVGSIIENAGKMGAPMPAFLAKAIAALKSGIDKAGTQATDTDSK